MEKNAIPFNLDASMNATEMIFTAQLIAAGLRKITPAYCARAVKEWKSLLLEPLEGQPKTTNVMFGLIVECCADPTYADRLLISLEHKNGMRAYEVANDD